MSLGRHSVLQWHQNECTFCKSTLNNMALNNWITFSWHQKDIKHFRIQKTYLVFSTLGQNTVWDVLLSMYFNYNYHCSTFTFWETMYFYSWYSWFYLYTFLILSWNLKVAECHGKKIKNNSPSQSNSQSVAVIISVCLLQSQKSSIKAVVI